MLTFGSLFAGIGGFDLGFERAGMKCKWQVELDEYARRVLEKHWPDVPRYGDIRTITELPYVDVVGGGFPCQDITHAGKGAGIHGAKSSLWFEMLRIIRMVRPPYVVVENSSALCEKGLDTVLAGLAESGYNAEWQVLPSSAFGASHERERTFLVAYSDSFGRQGILCNDTQDGSEKDYGTKAQPALGTVWNRLSRLEKELGEPSVFGENDGLPFRVDRLRCCGNAVVPQVAEFIGRRIVEAEGA